MRCHSEVDIMFPAHMSSQLKHDGQDATHALGVIFSQFIRQPIQRNITIAIEVDREISARLVHGLGNEP